MKDCMLERYGTEENINYNAYLRDGWPLLMHAVNYLQFDIASYLINCGANVNCQAGEFDAEILVKRLILKDFF